MFRSKVRTSAGSSIERRFRERQRLSRLSGYKQIWLFWNSRLVFLALVVFVLTLEMVMLLNTKMPTSKHDIPPAVHRPHKVRRNLRVDINGEVDFSIEEDKKSLQGPKLDELMAHLEKAMRPLQMRYLKSQAKKRSETLPPCSMSWTTHENTFLPGCPNQGCVHFDMLEEAKRFCSELDDCSGLVKAKDSSTYELRSSPNLLASKYGETAYLLIDSCSKTPTARSVWKAFSTAMNQALNNASMNLDFSYGAPREDNTIYLSIASYRDDSCPFTLEMAFERANNPENLYVGIVQQNCLRDCMTGTGWAQTRRWVPGEPDVDCAESFCAGKGKRFCENDQVRILRLEEIQAYGPFFSRYLNSKMWKGENFYVQIDAHTAFRSGWDTTLIEQMKATPTYPFSVISNYPPSGSPKRKEAWLEVSAYPLSPPSALCGCTFEGAGGKHRTVRLQETRRVFKNDKIPKRNAFVAAGFFVAHGSIVESVPFDPFMPFLFMGEEIALSVRLWTSGYEIYAPAVDVLRHEYVRKEHPKFWETVTMIFSNGGIHNALTDLIIPRVQVLLGFAAEEDLHDPDNVLIRATEYSVGKVRKVESFIEHVNIDLTNQRQTPPDWCRYGHEQLK